MRDRERRKYIYTQGREQQRGLIVGACEKNYTVLFRIKYLFINSFLVLILSSAGSVSEAGYSSSMAYRLDRKTLGKRSNLSIVQLLEKIGKA